MRYVCEDCNSIFTEPKEITTVVNNIQNTTNVCPICSSVNYHKDKVYKQQVEDLERFVSQLEIIKELITDIQIKAGNKTRDYAVITFSDLISDMKEIRNRVNRSIECLEEY